MKHDHKPDFVAALGKALREHSREEIFGLTYERTDLYEEKKA